VNLDPSVSRDLLLSLLPELVLTGWALVLLLFVAWRHQSVRDLRIAGAVTHSIGVLGTGAYQIDDGTGKIIVITKTGAPREGARVGVEGTFRSAFTFQTETAAVVVETDRRTR